MKTLVLGASGATGRLVAAQLLERGMQVKALLRPGTVMPPPLASGGAVEVEVGTVDDVSVERFQQLIEDCDAVISCLGHRITFAGMFGRPRHFVYNAVRRVCEAVRASGGGKKFVLMSTTAYTNTAQGESNRTGERIVFAALKLLLPPHRDNMDAGDYLFSRSGAEAGCEWVAVRPDSLIDADRVTGYDVVATRRRSPVFDAGKTSRINAAHFMAALLAEDALWQQWKCSAPVIYNCE